MEGRGGAATIKIWGGGEGWDTVRPCYKLPALTPLFCYISLLDTLNMKHLFCWQLIPIFLYLNSGIIYYHPAPAHSQGIIQAKKEVGTHIWMPDLGLSPKYDWVTF